MHGMYKLLNKTKIISIIFLIIYIILLFFFIKMGLEDSEKSKKTSSVITEVVTDVVEAITPDDYVVNQEKVSFLTRKIVGHFGYNLLMGVFLLLAIYFFFINKLDINDYKKFLIKYLCLGLIISIVVCVVSELIQLIPSGRSCEFKDMLIDFSGEVVGLSLVLLGFMIYCIKKNNKEKVTDNG